MEGYVAEGSYYRDAEGNIQVDPEKKQFAVFTLDEIQTLIAQARPDSPGFMLQKEYYGFLVMPLKR